MNVNMNVNMKIDRYNELTKAWLKGSEWVQQPNRTQIQLIKSEKRLFEILDEMSKIFNDLVKIGVEVEPEKLIKSSEKEKNKY